MGVGEWVGTSKSVLVNDRGWWVVEADRELIGGLISREVELVTSGSSEVSRTSFPVLCPGHLWTSAYGGLGDQGTQRQATKIKRIPTLFWFPLGFCYGVKGPILKK